MHPNNFLSRRRPNVKVTAPGVFGVRGRPTVRVHPWTAHNGRTNKAVTGFGWPAYDRNTLTVRAIIMPSTMADIEVNSTSEDGFTTTNRVGGFRLTIDANEEDGPSPNQALVADYASCYIAAFRVGAQQRGYDDLGRIELDAAADRDDDDDIESIRFDMHAEADIEGNENELIERGEEICHVHAALRDDLGADISVEGNAF